MVREVYRMQSCNITCSPPGISHLNLSKFFTWGAEQYDFASAGLTYRKTECVLSHFSRVWLFATLWNAACQVPLFHGILQSRRLEEVAMPSSRGSSWPRDQTFVSGIAGRLFTADLPGKPLQKISKLQNIYFMIKLQVTSVQQKILVVVTLLFYRTLTTGTHLCNLIPASHFSATMYVFVSYLPLHCPCHLTVFLTPESIDLGEMLTIYLYDSCF